MNHSAIDWNKRFMYTKTLSAMLLDLTKQSVIDIREKKFHLSTCQLRLSIFTFYNF